MRRKRIVLAMSGGVDSSVAAHLLVEQGYEVIGLFMRTGVSEPAAVGAAPAPHKIRGCCSAVDAADAQRVADRLNIPFYALNFADDLRRIKDYFADEYFRGRTPNPCVVCNTWLKFGKLWDYARAVEADGIATGHYARIVQGAAGAELHRADDPAKDQSYFLYGLRPELLDRIVFPVGGYPKSQVRALAEQHQLGVHQKPDSQEVCFVPSGNYQDFLHEHRPEYAETPGELVDEQGNVLARHGGVSHFTIGQRKGLGVALGKPRYVLAIEPETRRVVIGPRELLERETFAVEAVNWLLAEPPAGPISCTVKIRYLHQAVPAVVTPAEGGRALVRFATPQAAITPGQAAVFYNGPRVLGGGWIE